MHVSTMPFHLFLVTIHCIVHKNECDLMKSKVFMLSFFDIKIHISASDYQALKVRIQQFV